MRQSLRVVQLVLSLWMFGCYSTVNLVNGTFVSQSDHNRVLKLTPDVSQTPNVLIRAGIESGASKYFGKTVGLYSLQTSIGISTGKFVSFKPMNSNLQSITLKPDQGAEWTLRGQTDGSYADANGVVWKFRM